MLLQMLFMKAISLDVAVENGRKKLVKHETDWRNADNPIIAAYCIITRTDGEEFFEVMTKKTN